MAPKKKKTKDEWNGTNVEPENDLFNKDEDGEDLGGLMSLMNKKNKKKKKLDLSLLADESEITEKKESLEEAPVDNDVEDFEDAAAPVIAKNESKKKKKERATEESKAPKDKEQNEEEEPKGLKSKKEKERERKERAKLKKKKETKKEGISPAAATTATAEIKQPEEVESVVEIPVLPSAGKKGRKGQIAALRAAMEAQRAAEEERIRKEKEEEERLKREEEERILLEKQKEEEKEKKRLEKKLRKEELKKRGEYLTPAQKQQKKQQEAKLEAMLKAGMVVPALSGEKKKKPVYGKRKNNKQQLEKQEEKSVEVKVEAAEDSWDDNSDVEPVSVKAADKKVVENTDDLDSWDEGSSDEATPEPKKLGTTTKIAEKQNEPTPKTGAEEPAVNRTATKNPAQKAQEFKSAEAESEDEESSGDDWDESEDEELTAAEKVALQRKEDAKKRKEQRIKEAMAARSKDNLRSPICVILGHVDTGKTKILDKIRQTNVQEGEAGGITQQIGATYFPLSAIEEKTALIHKDKPSGYKLPGLLVIDTPGHESFTNLRSRGSSLCNIAVLVVDIVHGLEPQTLESLNMLRQRKTPFIVALNKIDRLYGWKTNPNFPTRDTLATQNHSVMQEFETRVSKTIVEFAEQGLNAALYWENKNVGKYVSLVPTSAVTGEGIPDLLHLLMDLTQNRLTERLMYLSELECTVLEVKVIEGLGTTIDVVLSNGVLREGDKICLCGLNGPIVTTVRALLTPQPMRELRVKSAYQHHKLIKASMGVKISAPDLENAIAGSRLLLIGPDDDEEEVMDSVMEDMQNLFASIDKSGKGVCVQASTLGSLEALLSFLKDSKIPVSGINIGPIHKKDIIRASVMLERCKEYAQILAFDVTIDKDARELAKEMGVKIFEANIIYHLFDQFTAYMKQLEDQKRADAMPKAIFPCVLRMVPDAIFNKRAPLIIGVDVIEGVLKNGTPLAVVKEDGQIFSLGKVVGIEHNNKSRKEAKKGDPSVAIRVENAPYETTATYGRHFHDKMDIYSNITRASIDVMKENFRDQMTKDDWALIIKLKKTLGIK